MISCSYDMRGTCILNIKCSEKSLESDLASKIRSILILNKVVEPWSEFFSLNPYYSLLTLFGLGFFNVRKLGRGYLVNYDVISRQNGVIYLKNPPSWIRQLRFEDGSEMPESLQLWFGKIEIKYRNATTERKRKSH